MWVSDFAVLATESGSAISASGPGRFSQGRLERGFKSPEPVPIGGGDGCFLSGAEGVDRCSDRLGEWCLVGVVDLVGFIYVEDSIKSYTERKIGEG